MKKPRSKDRGTFAGRATIAESKVPLNRKLLLARGRLRRVELQRETIHAVAQTGWLRAVVEHVAEMAAAAAAMNFAAHHAEGAIFPFAHGVIQRLIEARPAGAALELGF